MFNQCTFMGRMATDPKIHTTTTGKTVCSFRFAVQGYSKNEEKKAASADKGAPAKGKKK